MNEDTLHGYAHLARVAEATAHAAWYGTIQVSVPVYDRRSVGAEFQYDALDAGRFSNAPTHLGAAGEVNAREIREPMWRFVLMKARFLLPELLWGPHHPSID